MPRLRAQCRPGQPHDLEPYGWRLACLLGVVAHDAAAKVRCYCTGCDDIDRDAARAEFGRHVSRKHVDGSLHRGVRCSSTTRKASAGGRNIDNLAQALRRYTESCATTNPYPTSIEGFVVLRSDQPELPSYRLFQPALCIAIHGSKWATFGDVRYVYNAGQAIVVTVKMPSRGAVSHAKPGEPFLGFVLVLDLAVLHELVEQMSSQPRAKHMLRRPRLRVSASSISVQRRWIA
jgi:hypothetical protein